MPSLLSALLPHIPPHPPSSLPSDRACCSGTLYEIVQLPALVRAQRPACAMPFCVPPPRVQRPPHLCGLATLHSDHVRMDRTACVTHTARTPHCQSQNESQQHAATAAVTIVLATATPVSGCSGRSRLLGDAERHTACAVCSSVDRSNALPRLRPDGHSPAMACPGCGRSQTLRSALLCRTLPGSAAPAVPALPCAPSAMHAVPWLGTLHG